MQSGNVCIRIFGVLTPSTSKFGLAIDKCSQHRRLSLGRKYRFTRIDMDNFAILVALNVQSLASIGFAECTARLRLHLPWRVFVIERHGVDPGLTAYQINNYKPDIAALYVFLFFGQK